MPFSFPSPVRSWTRSTGSPISTVGFSRRNSTGRPTIISASLALEVSAGRVSPTTFPRRRTVMRSAISITSSSLWLMNTIVWPASRSFRRLPNRSWVSLGVSTAVGSSRMRISTPRYSAFRISTRCSSPTESSSTTAPGIHAEPVGVRELGDALLRRDDVEPLARPPRPG